MQIAFLVLALIVCTASAGGDVSLTPSNWDEMTSGKTVFIKFYAPWCGHCKKLAPDWKKLMAEFNDSKTMLVADVDCTAEGKPLCEANSVQGFPTLKWGDPSALEAYEGARTLDALKKFATENLKPICSPKNIDLCDAEKKAEITKFQAMSVADLDTLIAAKETELSTAEETFKEAVKKLQSTYEELKAAQDETMASVKASGLGLMKSVKALGGDSKSEL
jgi:protein disulfide-isomerase-like protein